MRKFYLSAANTYNRLVMLNFPSVGTKNKVNKDLWLKKTLAKIPKGKKILDAGAGQLQYKKFCRHLRYIAQDFCQYNGKGNNEGLQKGVWDQSKIDIVSDIIKIPVTVASFDVVMCVEVLEHIPYPDKAIKEFSRILKKGGRLILTTPFCSLTHYAPYYFTNGFSKYWYEKILPKNGFKIKEIRPNGNFFEYLAQEIRRIPDVEEKYSKNHLACNLINRIAIYSMLRLLQKLSTKDKKSHELLCFGYFVLATKK